MNSKELTEQLLEFLHRLKKIHDEEEAPENRRDKVFFEKVKGETGPIFNLLDKWEEIALQTVKQRKVNIHPQQITSTKENMELFIMHSYYHDARKKNYMEMYNSILYIFEQFISDLA